MVVVLMAIFFAICIIIAQAKRRPVEIVTVSGAVQELFQYSSGTFLSAGIGALSGSTNCVALAVPLCHKHRVPYSHSVPGHEARADEIAKFEPMVQVKCSKLLALFVCTTLAPACVERGREVPPCKSLCEEVMRSCSFFMGVFSLKWSRISNCTHLPESSDRSVCVGKYEIEKLRMSKERCDNGFRCDKSRCISKKWVCDGHYDCQDRSDELNCNFWVDYLTGRCPGEFRCSASAFTGTSSDCVAKSKVCDGTMDCTDGSDERQCLQLNHRMGFVGEGRLELFSTAAGGFVPVCAEEWLSSSESTSSGRGGPQQLAEFDWSRNTCKLLGYDQVQETRIRDDSPSIAFIGGVGHPPLRFNPSTRNGIHSGPAIQDGSNAQSPHNYPGSYSSYNLNSMGGGSSSSSNNNNNNNDYNSNLNKHNIARQPSANDLRKFRKHLFDRQKETACASSGVSVYLKCTNFSCGRRAEDMRLSRPQSRIVGGSESPPGRWPWLVAVHGGSDHVFFCGGVLISSWWVLTAAHCAGNSTDPAGWLLQMGMTRRNSAQPSSTQSRHIQAVVKHPDFNNASLYNNDIALLLLSDPVSFDDFLRPLCLPPEEPLAPGMTCTVVGWGKSHHAEDAEYNMVIHEVDVPIVDFETCQGWYMKEDILISDSMICAGYAEGQKDACQGDSGGPLVCRTGSGGPWFVAGIVSWGIKCAQPHLPGIYTNVPRYLDWIREITTEFGHPLDL
ncbi:transmembrane protease serine 2-like isoform X5 [Varroa destructor]|nr:transmembrane protease serine 2-like isoform X5 [Varroa destructor]